MHTHTTSTEGPQRVHIRRGDLVYNDWPRVWANRSPRPGQGRLHSERCCGRCVWRLGCRRGRSRNGRPSVKRPLAPWSAVTARPRGLQPSSCWQKRWVRVRPNATGCLPRHTLSSGRPRGGRPTDTDAASLARHGTARSLVQAVRHRHFSNSLVSGSRTRPDVLLVAEVFSRKMIEAEPACILRRAPA